MITDMTVGKPAAVLWKFSFPMLISSMFQQIYNIADSAIVGQICGDDGLAAIGASYSITMLFVAAALGCNAGCSVVISQFFGAKQYSKTKTAINTSYISVLILSTVLTVVGCICCRPVLSLVLLILISIHTDLFFCSCIIFVQVYLHRWGIPILRLFS